MTITGSILLILIVALFIPMVALVTAIWLFLQGEVGLAILFLVWWMLWEEQETENVK